MTPMRYIRCELEKQKQIKNQNRKRLRKNRSISLIKSKTDKIAVKNETAIKIAKGIATVVRKYRYQ